MKLSRFLLLTFFWSFSLVIGVLLPMACTDTSSKFLPTSPSTPVVASATATNAFGFTSTPTFTLQPTFTPTNTATPAPTMQSPSVAYTPNSPGGIAVAGSPATVYVAGGDGTLSIYNGGTNPVVTQYNSTLFSSLAGVAVDATNHLCYVLDSGSGASAGTVYEFDISGAIPTPVTSWNNWSNGNIFNQPDGIAVDTAGNVYVADTQNDQIDVFSSGGSTSVKQWGAIGQGNGLFNGPTGVAVTVIGSAPATCAGVTITSGTPVTLVCVADSGNHSIQVFNASGVWQNQFSTVGNSNVEGITLDQNGNLYAADYNTAYPLVEQYNKSGILTAQWSGAGATYFGPTGVAWANPLLYVADYANNKVYSITP